MILSLKETHVRGKEPAAIFDYAAELGCCAVHIHLPDRPRLAQILRAMHSSGVGVASVGAMHCGMLGPDPALQLREHRQVERALWTAAECGAATVSQFAGGDPTVDLPTNTQRWAELYEPHALLAEKLGLRIVFENCPMTDPASGRPRNLFYCPAHWDAFFDACPHPALGIEFDLSHFAYTGIDPVPLVAQYAHRIHHVHLKDVLLDPEQTQRRGVLGGIPHTFVPVGQGQVPIVPILRALHAHRYSGFLTSDYEKPYAAAIAANVQGIVESAEKAGIALQRQRPAAPQA